MKYKLYLVGGFVRDKLLGLESKDIDYSVVIDESYFKDSNYNPQLATKHFATQIESEGYKVFLVTPDCFTVRAKFPDDSPNNNLVADFVLARKEDGYIKGTRTPIVKLGTLYDDLIRRDFTINALAQDDDGNIIDYFGGLKDLNKKILRTPTDVHESFTDDPLRILRALRFYITKEFGFSDQVLDGIKYFNGDFSVVSKERVQNELNKMFDYDVYGTLELLQLFKGWNYNLFLSLFSGDWKLNMTNKR